MLVSLVLLLIQQIEPLFGTYSQKSVLTTCSLNKLILHLDSKSFLLFITSHFQKSLHQRGPDRMLKHQCKCGD